MATKNQVTLEIAGARYKMTSDADESHLQRLAEVVNERIAALGTKAARTASPAQMLAVVALGLADDLLSAEERRERLESLTRDTVTRAIARIDRHLGDGDGDGAADGDGAGSDGAGTGGTDDDGES